MIKEIRPILISNFQSIIEQEKRIPCKKENTVNSRVLNRPTGCPFPDFSSFTVAVMTPSPFLLPSSLMVSREVYGKRISISLRNQCHRRGEAGRGKVLECSAVNSAAMLRQDPARALGLGNEGLYFSLFLFAQAKQRSAPRRAARLGRRLKIKTSNLIPSYVFRK